MTIPLVLSLLLAFLAVALWYRGVARRSVALLAATLFLLSLLLSGAYLVADSLSGAGIDESVLFHIKAGVKGTDFTDFYQQFALGGAFLGGGFLLAVLVYKLALVKTGATTHRIRVFSALLVSMASLAIAPATGDLVYLYRKTLFQTLETPAGFVPLKPVAASSPPKNFVLLYLESIERTFFDETLFPGLMPNLKALEKEAVSFTDMTQASGTGWSIAGMAAGLCGVPLVGAAATNSMSGMDTFLPAATCVGDILNTYGYELEHFDGSDLDFAGWGTFFRTHGFDKVNGLKELEPQLPENAVLGPWGLHDENLLEIALQRYQQLAQEGAPFGIVLNTVDTHSPDGHPGPYCDGITYGDGENEYLNTLHCADQMAAEFITNIRTDPAFDNTVLMVASDHLAMPNSVWEQLNSAGNRRNLLMIFSNDVTPALVAKTGSSFDVGATLLAQIGFPVSGVGFGRNLLDGAASLVTSDPSLEDLIFKSTGFFVSLWSYPQLGSGVAVDTNSQKLSLGKRHISFPVLLTLNDDLSVIEANFDFYDGYPLLEKAKNLAFDERFFWVDSCENINKISFTTLSSPSGYCMAEGMLGGADIKAAPVANQEEITFPEIQTFFASLSPSADIYQTQLANIVQFEKFGVTNAESLSFENDLVGKYVIESKGGYRRGESVLRNVDTDEELVLSRGLTLLGINPQASPQILAYADTCAFEIPLEALPPLETDFASTMAENASLYGAFLIILHDSALCSRYDIAPLFADTELEQWAEIGPRSPYIAVISGTGEVREFIGPRETALTVAVEHFVGSRKQR